MRRAILTILLVFLIVGIVGAGFAWQRGNTLSSTPTENSCQMIDVHGTPDIQLGMAIDSLYEQMPHMKTPVALFATQDKPFAVGCLAGE